MKFKFKVAFTILYVLIVTLIMTKVSIAEEYKNNETMANLSIGTVSVDSIGNQQEVELPIKVDNIDSLCSGTLIINCNGLEFIDLENKNENFQFETAKNDGNGKITISFSSTKGLDGNIDLAVMRLKLPEKVKDDSVFYIMFNDDTSLSTIKTTSTKYTINNGEVRVKKGNYSELKKSLVVSIVLGVISGIFFILILKTVFSKKNSGRKKSLIIIYLIMCIAAGIGCYHFVKKDISSNVKSEMNEAEAVTKAKYAYETLLNFYNGRYLSFEMDDNNKGYKVYKFEDKNYAKINDYNGSVKKNVTDDFENDFSRICGIIEKDGDYYIKLENVNRQKDYTYIGSSLSISEFSDREIKAEILSKYSNFSENKENTIKHNFVMKKIGNDWKVSEFSLPY